jgi:dTMP kinase
VATLIRPSLEADKIVITDRYYFSTVAYQGARGLEPAELLRQNEAIALEPHLLVLIDLDAETCLARIRSRGQGVTLFESTEQLARCRQIFLSIRKPYLLRLDGRASPDELRDEILVAFSRTAVERIAQVSALTPAQKLAAVLALHGAPSGAA